MAIRREWRDACELRLRSRQKKRKRKATKELKNLEAAGTDGEGSSTEQLPRIEIDPVGEGAPREHRKVVRIAREMFTSSIEEDVTGMIMSHTKL